MASTVRARVTRNEQEAEPEHPPAQWLNRDLLVPCGVKTRRVPDANPTRQTVGHAMPPGKLTTLPWPTTNTVTAK
jgi:hypothetical protein